MFFVFHGPHTDPAGIRHPARPAARPRPGRRHTATKITTGYWAAHRAGIGPKGRRHAGGPLVARGEFSVVIARPVVIAGPAVTAGIEPSPRAMATAYVLILVIVAPSLPAPPNPWPPLVRETVSDDDGAGGLPRRDR